MGGARATTSFHRCQASLSANMSAPMTKRSCSVGSEVEIACSVSSVRLGDLSADRVDMLTLVLVGSSQTRSVERRHGVPWVYTPRGYSAEAAG